MPAACAGSQIARAFSRAMASPSAGQRLPDGALSFTLTSAALYAVVGFGEQVEQVHVGVAGGGRPHGVGGVLAEVVDGRQPVRGAQLTGDGHGIRHALARDVAGDDCATDRSRHHRLAHEIGLEI